jgi:hypothetical protein
METAPASSKGFRSGTRSARISLAVGYIVMLLAPVTMGASGPVFMGALAAAFGLVPLVLGPARYRALAVLPLVIGAAVAADAYPGARKEMQQYAIRGQLAEVVNLGTAIAAALDRHAAGARPVPGSIDELGISAPREKVANVRIQSSSQFAIGLALPALAGKELVFVAASVEGARTWKCTSRGLEPRYRPSACRDEIDAALRAEGK